MASNVFDRSYICCINRIISVTVIAVYGIISPIYCSSIKDEFKSLNADLDARILVMFDEIKETISTFENRNEELARCVHELLNEVNYIFNSSITFSDLFENTQEYLVSSDLDVDIKKHIMQIIYNIHDMHIYLNSNGKISSQEIYDDCFSNETAEHHIYNPWEWNWFGLNTKNKGSKDARQATKSFGCLHALSIPQDDESIPDDLILAGVEIMTAVLLALLPCGSTQAAAAIIFADAIARGAAGLKQLSDANREKGLPPVIPANRILIHKRE